jgi:HK97 family phage prohead protease
MQTNRIYWRQKDLDKLGKRREVKQQPGNITPANNGWEIPTAIEKNDTDNSKTYRFVITSDAKDRGGDTLAIDGWNTKMYARNPVVQFAHNAQALPIGRTKSLYQEGNKLVAEMQFSRDGFAQRVKKQVDEGMLVGASVGFVPGEWKFVGNGDGIEFKSGHELLEWSVCPVPCNGDATLQRTLTPDERKHARAARARELDEQVRQHKIADKKRLREQTVREFVEATTPEERKALREKNNARYQRLVRLNNVKGGVGK